MYILYKINPVKKRKKYQRYTVIEQSEMLQELMDSLAWQIGHWEIRSAMGEKIIEVQDGKRVG